MRRLLRATPIRTDLGLLALRLYVGSAFAMHGWSKLERMDRFTSSVADMGFPLATLFAWSAVATELVGGILVALGLLLRPVLVPAAVTMAVAVGRHDLDWFGEAEHAMLYLVAFVTLFLTGPGRWSLDAVLFGGRR